MHAKAGEDDDDDDDDYDNEERVKETMSVYSPELLPG